MELIAQTTLGAVLIGAVAWLARSLVGHLLSKDVEIFKANLAAEHAQSLEIAKKEHQSELERFKFELKAQAMERQIRFEHLHQKRFELIYELHNEARAVRGVTWTLYKRVQQNGHIPPDIVTRATERISKFDDFFETNRIFFSTEVCALIDEYRNKLLVSAVSYLEAEKDEAHLREFVERIRGEGNRATEQLSALEKQIRSELRELIGS